MKTRINRNFITQTNSDNASLNSMTTVAHRFPESGDYRGVVHFKGSPVRSFRIGVAKPTSATAQSGAAPTKVEVNLRALNLARGSETEESRYELEEGGYAVFRVPAGTGGGYAVEVHRSTESGEGHKVFDSRELDVNDLLAVVLIRPGIYSVECTTEGTRKTKAELTVTYPEKALKPLDPVRLKCGKEGISTDKLKVQPMQGLVFSFEAPSRIKIELVTPDDRPRVSTPKPAPRATERERLTRRYLMVPRRLEPK
jgi:hypothetical protein